MLSAKPDVTTICLKVPGLIPPNSNHLIYPPPSPPSRPCSHCVTAVGFVRSVNGSESDCLSWIQHCQSLGSGMLILQIC